MQIVLTVIHLFLAIGLIGLILIQHGRGADAGAAFGSGASATVFGARGSGSFLSRTTAILAALFFITSVVMAYYAQHSKAPEGLMDGATGAIQVEMPAVAPGAGVPVTTPAPISAQVSGDVPTPPAAVTTPVQRPVQMQVPAQAPVAPSAPMSSGDVPPMPMPAAPEAGAKP
jgi:preprotein translocase subunit SecG